LWDNTGGIEIKGWLTGRRIEVLGEEECVLRMVRGCPRAVTSALAALFLILLVLLLWRSRTLYHDLHKATRLHNYNKYVNTLSTHYFMQILYYIAGKKKIYKMVFGKKKFGLV